MTSHRCARALAGLLVCAAAADGATTSWSNAAGDRLWSNPANWTAGVPGPADAAVFAEDAGTIDLGSADRAIGTLNLGAGVFLENGRVNTPHLLAYPSGPAFVSSSYEVYTSSAALDVQGDISGTLVDPPGGGTYTLTGSATFYRQSPGFTGPVSMFSAQFHQTGGLPAAGSMRYPKLGGVTLWDDGAASAVDRLPDNAEIRLDSSQISILHRNATQRFSESVGTIDLAAGESNIWSTPAGTTAPFPATVLSAAGLTRSPGATAKFLRSNLVDDWRVLLRSAPPMSGGGSGPTRLPVMPYLIGSLCTYDTGPDPADPADDIGIRWLDPDTEYASSIAPGISPDNVRLSSPQTLSSDAAINSLFLGAGIPLTLDGARLRVAGGAIAVGWMVQSPSSGDAVINGTGTLELPAECIIQNSSRIADFQVPLTGGMLVVAGGVRLSRANSYTGGTVIHEGALSIAAPGGLGTGPVTLSCSEQKPGSIRFERAGQTFDAPFFVENGDDSSGTERYVLADIGLSDGVHVTLNGPVGGQGGLRPTGSGTLSLNGDGTFRFLRMTVECPTEMNGTWAARTASDLSANLRQSSSALAGNGSFLGAVALVNGRIAPGTFGSVGRLSLDKLVCAGGTLEFALAGIEPGIGYDQLAILSSLGLGGSSLALSLEFPASLGDVFTIIDDRFAGPLTSTFNGLPEGSILWAGGRQLQISYLGGDGNDVTLTVIPEPALLGLALLAPALTLRAGRQRSPEGARPPRARSSR